MKCNCVHPSPSIAAFRAHRTNLALCTIVCFSLSLFLLTSMARPLFLSVWVCVCRCLRNRERAYHDFLPRDPWPAKPALTSLVMLLQYFCAACPGMCPVLHTKHGWWQGVSSMIFPKTTPGAQILALVFQAFSNGGKHVVARFSVVAGNVGYKKTTKKMI